MDNTSEYIEYAMTIKDWLILLIVQEKFDITSEYINPTDLLRMRLKDFETDTEFSNKIKQNINSIISDLSLNKRFKVE